MRERGERRERMREREIERGKGGDREKERDSLIIILGTQRRKTTV